jgi:hypothetical protein
MDDIKDWILDLLYEAKIPLICGAIGGIIGTVISKLILHL